MMFPNVVDFNAKVEWRYQAFIARTRTEILRQLDLGQWRVRIPLTESFPNLEPRLIKDVREFLETGECPISLLAVEDDTLCINFAVDTFPPP